MGLRALIVILAVGLLAACSSDKASTEPTIANVTATDVAGTSVVSSPADSSPADSLPVDSSPVESSTTSSSVASAFDPAAVGAVSIEGPITSGNGKIQLGAGGFDLATVGYEEQEYFLSGTAAGYESATALTSDGHWTVAPTSQAPFTTRIVVRRPIDPSRFNGSVAVEWLNVTSGFDNAPDWSYAHTELIRAGWVWVGVSAQAVGILGGGNALGAALALKAVDPVRYAPLAHPGDSYSYDMFSQAGAAVRTQPETVLTGLVPQHVIAFGESQSAFRLTTYINAVAPITNVYDGYLVHSRGAAGAALSQEPQADIKPPDPTLIRDDVQVPVLTFLSETDMVGDRLGYSRARQDDTDVFRAWEVPGTAHADVYNLGVSDSDDGSGVADTQLFAALTNPPNSIYGGVITCDRPLNAGPHTYVLRAAIAALHAWVAQGVSPPPMPRIELDAAGAVVPDALGNATGGIRTPHVDAPIATLSGSGQSGESFCGLFGTTAPFDAATLRAQYADHAAFVARWSTAIDAAVQAGAILPADATRLRDVAETSSIGD